jgi:Uma2 family endonuclease
MTKFISESSNFEFRWSLERYHQLIEMGLLTELDKVELLFGKIITKMPVGEPHADVLSDIADFFYERLGTKFKFRAQSPVTLPNDSEPEPDFAVVVRRKYNRTTGHPKPEDILLLIEVADSTLQYDRTQKAEAYALAGVKEYWIINIPERQVELHLKPSEEKGLYRSLSVYESGSRFTSPFCGEVEVDEVLPEPEEE